MNIIKKLKSPELGTLLAFISVLVQSFHSFTAFYNTSSLKGTAWGIAQAVLFAAIFDVAILYFTLRNRKDVVLGAAVFMAIINFYYYYQHLGLTFEFIFGCLLSMVLPVQQYYYSEEIVVNDGPTPLQHELEGAYKDRDAWKDQVKELQAVIRNGKEDNKRLIERIDLSEKTARDHFKALQQVEAMSVEAQRDADKLMFERTQALNSNSVLSEALGIKDREIFELKKEMGLIPAGAEIDPEEQKNRTLQEVIESPRIDDKNKAEYRPIRTNGPL